MKNMGGSSEKVKMELGTQKWENEANNSKKREFYTQKSKNNKIC
jgi:hypothetical protein